jgi:hypothetical protein
VVPRIAFGIVNLHHADSALHQARSSQAASRRAAFAVQLEGRLVFFADVIEFRSAYPGWKN